MRDENALLSFPNVVRFLATWKSGVVASVIFKQCCERDIAKPFVDRVEIL